MDNAQKAIMIGVGLFVTLLIIAAVMLIVNPSIGLIDSATNRVVNINSSLEQMLYQKYDETTVTGAEVKSFVQQNATDQKMVIEIQAAQGSNILELGKAKGNGTESLENATTYPADEQPVKYSQLNDSSNSNTYVPDSARYEAKLIQNSAKDVVLGVIFKRIK